MTASNMRQLRDLDFLEMPELRLLFDCVRGGSWLTRELQG